MVGGAIFLLLLVRCGGLLERGPGRGLWCCAGLCLLGGALAYSRFVSGGSPGIDVLLGKMGRRARRHQATPGFPRHNSQTTTKAADRQRLDDTYAKLPQSFEANRGQMEVQVKFGSPRPPSDLAALDSNRSARQFQIPRPSRKCRRRAAGALRRSVWRGFACRRASSERHESSRKAPRCRGYRRGWQ
jgi:hypothetical protein